MSGRPKVDDAFVEPGAAWLNCPPGLCPSRAKGWHPAVPGRRRGCPGAGCRLLRKLARHEVVRNLPREVKSVGSLPGQCLPGTDSGRDSWSAPLVTAVGRAEQWERGWAACVLGRARPEARLCRGVPCQGLAFPQRTVIVICAEARSKSTGQEAVVGSRCWPAGHPAARHQVRLRHTLGTGR